MQKNTKNAGKLNIFMASEPDHIDPALNSTVDGGCLAVNSFEGLMRYNAEGKLEPACAESYEVSEDGLTYTFTMRDGLKWSNGDELTAKDFEWSWRRAADPKTAADYSYLCAVFAGYDDTKGLAADDVVASDDGKTLTVKLKAVTPYFLDLCAFPFFFPVNQKSVEGNDDWANDASDKFVTNGAFTLKEWKHDSSMTYVKNPNYWDADNVTVDEMNVMLTSDDVSAYTAYQNGDLDFIDTVPTAEIEAAKKTSEFYTVDNLGTYYVGFNINSKLYSELGVRLLTRLRYSEKQSVFLSIVSTLSIQSPRADRRLPQHLSQRALQMVTVASSRTRTTTAQITIRTLRRLKSFLLLSDY